jgi:hypothetical protein
MAMTMIDLQRRQPSERADQLLDGLQAAVAPAERVHWNESGHARLAVAGQPDEVRAAMVERLSSLGDDWSDHIAIL